eukprot:scaffold21634_cov63-Phaeocystis_antarctica.AAC.2
MATSSTRGRVHAGFEAICALAASRQPRSGPSADVPQPRCSTRQPPPPVPVVRARVRVRVSEVQHPAAATTCTCGATVHGTRYTVRTARPRLVRVRRYVQHVEPRGRRPRASGTYSTQEVPGITCQHGPPPCDRGSSGCRARAATSASTNHSNGPDLRA